MIYVGNSVIFLDPLTRQTPAFWNHSSVTPILVKKILTPSHHFRGVLMRRPKRSEPARNRARARAPHRAAAAAARRAGNQCSPCLLGRRPRPQSQNPERHFLERCAQSKKRSPSIRTRPGHPPGRCKWVRSSDYKYAAASGTCPIVSGSRQS